MHHQIGIGLAYGCCGGLRIRQINSHQLVALNRLRQRLNAGEIAGITQLVEIEHNSRAVAQQAPHHRASNEARTAGDQHPRPWNQPVGHRQGGLLLVNLIASPDGSTEARQRPPPLSTVLTVRTRITRSNQVLKFLSRGVGELELHTLHSGPAVSSGVCGNGECGLPALPPTRGVQAAARSGSYHD